MADGDMPIKKQLNRDVNRIGNSFIFPPRVMDDIHIKSELGRYRMRGFSLFKKIPHWDDLTFLPGTLTRFVIEGYREKCETKTVIGPRAKRPINLDIPIYITGMSFGALSYEAKTALARGATMAGTATCSGEGGMLPEEQAENSRYFYELASAKFGWDLRHAEQVQAFHFNGSSGYSGKTEHSQNSCGNADSGPAFFLASKIKGGIKQVKDEVDLICWTDWGPV